jgi:hypothetical protein
VGPGAQNLAQSLERLSGGPGEPADPINTPIRVLLRNAALGIGLGPFASHRAFGRYRAI